MRVLVVVVGKRTEHWEGLFAALARRSDLEVLVHAADVSELASVRLAQLARDHDNFTFRLSPHTVGEDLTGHMASVMFRRDAWRGLCEERPDVVHLIGEAAYLATHQTLRFRNRVWPETPVTLYAAQNVVTRFPFPFPALERYAYRHVSLALPITPAALEVLRAKGYRGPAKIIPLGTDLQRFRPRCEPPAAPFTVGFVGRLEPWKGVADLLEAQDRLGCRLLVVGEGSLRPWLEAEAARRADAIEVVPWASHDELPTLFGRMHALAFPSREVVQRNVLPWIKVPLREQFGRVLVEAMACGVPTVAYRVGEIPHVVGDAGLVVSQHAASLAAGLAAVRDDPALAAELRQAGPARAGLFDWRRIADEICETWIDLIHGRRARAA